MSTRAASITAADARAVVVGAGRVGRRVHDVGHPAVDMACDDDDVVGPLGAALDRDHVAHARRRRDARAGEGFGRIDDGQAIAARRRVPLELAAGPFERGADAALGVGLRRQSVPRSEADQNSIVCRSCAGADRRDNGAQLRIGGRRRCRGDQSHAGQDCKLAHHDSPSRPATGISRIAGLGEPRSQTR